MMIRTALLGLVGTALLSSAALAAADTNHPANRMQMADRCATLESQYDAAIASHEGAANFDVAQGLGSSGTAECRNDEGTLGARKLEQALAILDVKPQA